jgi:uncharacterized protein
MKWRQFHYNLIAPNLDGEGAVIANLFRGTCAVYSPVELFLLDEIESLDEKHPILERFQKRRPLEPEGPDRHCRRAG